MGENEDGSKAAASPNLLALSSQLLTKHHESMHRPSGAHLPSLEQGMNSPSSKMLTFQMNSSGSCWDLGLPKLSHALFLITQNRSGTRREQEAVCQPPWKSASLLASY